MHVQKLQEILNSPNGAKIVNYYNANKKFDDANRNKLVNLILDFIYGKKFTLKSKDIDNLAEQIVLKFPAENKVNLKVWFFMFRSKCNIIYIFKNNLLIGIILFST